MHLLDLNSDVLLLITTFLSRPDISKLTRTCRFLHDALIHRLLMGTVSLTRSSFAPFCQFMQAQSEPDCPRDLTPFLRSLEISIGPNHRYPMSPGETIQAFTDLLSNARHLLSLSIYWISMAFTPERLQRALSVPLPCLQQVTLHDVTAQCRDALAMVAPQLRTISLCMSQDFGDSPLNRRSLGHVDPLPFLHQHRETVTSLKLLQVVLSDGGEPVPNVRELTILSFSLDNNDTGWAAPLIHLFPNVEHVDLWNLYTREGSSPTRNTDVHDRATISTLASWRSRSKDWQRGHGTWTTGLRYLRVCSIMDLYCLGLSCQVSRLDLYIASPSLEITTAALADCRPRCIWFTISSPNELNVEIPALMGSVARTPSVIHLMCNIADGMMLYSDSRDLLVRLGSLLRETAVTNVVIDIREIDFPERGSIFGQPLWDVTSTPRSIDGSSEHPEVLRLLGHGNTKLDRVFVDYQLGGVRAWEMHQVGKEPRVRWEEVEPTRVREIMVAEGLARCNAWTVPGF
ncbi:hypothetical protein C2E23DRAFT_836118 [Lenzites betulinus]|nr:hypothetical protein C2E23DRAFT_836118 [Lenzites betulinus]